MVMAVAPATAAVSAVWHHFCGSCGLGAGQSGGRSGGVVSIVYLLVDKKKKKKVLPVVVQYCWCCWLNVDYVDSLSTAVFKIYKQKWKCLKIK